MEIKLSKRELKLIKEFEKELADIKRRELIEAPLLKHIRNIEKTRNLNSGEGRVYIYIKVSPFEWRPYKHTFRSHLGASMFAETYFKNMTYKILSDYDLMKRSITREKRVQLLKKAGKYTKKFLENTAKNYREHYNYNLVVQQPIKHQSKSRRTHKLKQSTSRKKSRKNCTKNRTKK